MCGRGDPVGRPVRVYAPTWYVFPIRADPVGRPYRASVSEKSTHVILNAGSASGYYLVAGLQPGKKVLATILEVCPLVALLLGRK
jgi:hypothetical protein